MNLSLLSNDSQGTTDIEIDWVRSNSRQHMEYQSLEPAVLGGIFTGDRFTMVVATKRPTQDILPSTLASQEWRSMQA